MVKSRFFNICKRTLLGFAILFSVQLQGQEINNDTLKTLNKESNWIPTTSLYIELGGKFFPSINVDFRKKENFALCIGTSFWFDAEGHKQLLILPSVNGYYLGGKRHRLEIGGGLGPFIGTYMGLSSIELIGNIGYRYQKKKGLIFRIGFTPLMAIPISKDARFMAIPWAGISLGYSF